MSDDNMMSPPWVGPCGHSADGVVRDGMEYCGECDAPRGPVNIGSTLCPVCNTSHPSGIPEPIQRLVAELVTIDRVGPCSFTKLGEYVIRVEDVDGRAEEDAHGIRHVIEYQMFLALVDFTKRLQAHAQAGPEADVRRQLRGEVERLRALAIRETAPYCEHFDVNEKGRIDCTEPHMFEVSWSDRHVKCCAGHLAAVKRSAANDGSGDRTENPYIVGTSGADLLMEIMGTKPTGGSDR